MLYLGPSPHLGHEDMALDFLPDPLAHLPGLSWVTSTRTLGTPLDLSGLELYQQKCPLYTRRGLEGGQRPGAWGTWEVGPSLSSAGNLPSSSPSRTPALGQVTSRLSIHPHPGQSTGLAGGAG